MKKTLLVSLAFAGLVASAAAAGAGPLGSTESKGESLVTQVATYVCVDRGKGTPVAFEGIISTSRTWHGRHLRVNLGKTSVTVIANGKHVPLAVGPNPAGLDFTPGHHKNIPAGSRPCG